MKVIFIHQNMPGQFVHMARYLGQREDCEVIFITKPTKEEIPGVRKIEYKPIAQKPPGTDPYIQGFQNAICHGKPVAQLLNKLRREGFTPDIVVAHPGWGEAMYVKDVLPNVPLLNYFEFYYHAFGADVHFDPAEPREWNNILRIRTKNSTNLLALEAADWGLTPTYWQFSLQPEIFQPKISIIHEGVDTRKVQPNHKAQVKIPSGHHFEAGQEIVTYVARDMDPYRGFPTAMRAIERLCKERPNCQFLIVGGDKSGYGKKLPDGTSHRDEMLKEVDLDMNRVHFLGKLPYDAYLQILQISAAHIYLTKPFVLSWSMMESLASGCLVVGSDTEPVREVIKDGWNGLLVDFFSPEDVAARVSEALDKRQKMLQIRKNARQTILDRYDLAKTLPAQLRLLQGLARHQRPTASRMENFVPPGPLKEAG
jgi:glycosyltransferase involved in cell wall biosynthesis